MIDDRLTGRIPAMKTNLAAIAILIAGQFAVPLTAGADRSPAVSRQLALARICAKEEGWRITDGCAGIHSVLTRGSAAAGMSYVGFARAYAGNAFVPAPGRPWTADLQPDGREPRGWPVGVSWARWRASWLAIYRHAGQVLGGEVESACEQPPRHWGSATDSERPQRYGWVRVQCGDSHNLFWVPRREAPRG